MAKSIYEMQNEDIYLKCLASQRKTYSKAKTKDTIINLLVIMVVVYQIVLCWIAVDNYQIIKILIPIAVFLVNLYLSSEIKKEKKSAAALQEYIDVNLYSKVLDKDLKEWGYTYSRDKLNNLLSQCQLDKNDINGVKNWYEDYSSLSPIQQVYSCQSENIRWDSKLRKKYIKWMVISLIAYILLFLFSITSEIIVTIICAVPVIKWLVSNIYDTHKDCLRLNSIKEQMEKVIQQIERKNIKNEIIELAELQKRIKENRESAKLIPDFFYKIYAGKFHEQEEYIADNKNYLNERFSSNKDVQK